MQGFSAFFILGANIHRVNPGFPIKQYFFGKQEKVLMARTLLSIGNQVINYLRLDDIKKFKGIYDIILFICWTRVCSFIRGISICRYSWIKPAYFFHMSNPARFWYISMFFLNILLDLLICSH